MQQVDLYVRIVFCGVALGAATFLGACQQTGNKSATGQQVASSSQISQSMETALTSAHVVAYTSGTMPARPLPNCNLEAAGTTKFGAQPIPLKSGEKYALAGWIDASGLVQPTYWIRFDDQAANRYLQMPVTLTIQRPDVASANAGTPLVSGFNADLPAGDLREGKYHVYLAVKASGTIYVCDNGRYVTVTP